MPRLTIEKKAGAKPLTVAQRLDRIIKSARQIMRKDKGLNGDLDRLPMLTWIMFLKFLDDMERIEETRAGLDGRAYRSVVEAPWRWRDWAAPADGITGADLLTFLSAEETVLPNGSSGPGLFLSVALGHLAGGRLLLVHGEPNLLRPPPPPSRRRSSGFFDESSAWVRVDYR